MQPGGERRVPAEAGQLTEGANERETSLAAAIRGDLASAKGTFSRGSEILDLKYWANLEALSGTHTGRERAIDLFARALKQDPTDLYVIGWLLDREAETPSPRVVDLLKMKSIVPDVLEALEAAVHVSPNDHRLWRRLATLLALQGGDSAQQRRFAERAELSARRMIAPSAAYSAATPVRARSTGWSTKWATQESAHPSGALKRDTPRQRHRCERTCGTPFSPAGVRAGQVPARPGTSSTTTGYKVTAGRPAGRRPDCPRRSPSSQSSQRPVPRDVAHRGRGDHAHDV
jgi:hypothetical protein